MLRQTPIIVGTPGLARLGKVFLCAVALALPSQLLAQTLTTLPYDHVDPVVLNEYAVSLLKAGDRATALILLERAARLAPFDSRITANLNALRQSNAGIAVEGRTESQVGSETKAAPSLPNPPPPWKLP